MRSLANATPRTSGWTWTAIATGWTVVALLSAVQTALYLIHNGIPFHWPSLIGGRLLDWGSLAMFTPLMLWLARRFPIERRVRGANIVILVGAATAIVLAKYAILVPVSRRVLPAQFRWTLGGALMSNAVMETLCALAVVGLIQMIVYRERLHARELEAAQLNAELARSRVEALTFQLQPHFLFNTLNTVVSLIGRDPRAAEDTLVQLGALLRVSLDERAVVPLSEEREVLEVYLGIMRRRYASGIERDVDIPPRLEVAMVPRFILQPLVENAIKHGMSPNGWRGRIHITARDEGEQLVLTVADDGVGFGRGADHLETAPANGVGLQNTRRRLAALYGDRARLELGRSSLGGARVELRLPLTIAS